ncbi:unnamed protein product, partial [Iphiclides podalirius]
MERRQGTEVGATAVRFNIRFRRAHKDFRQTTWAPRRIRGAEMKDLRASTTRGDITVAFIHDTIIKADI